MAAPAINDFGPLGANGETPSRLDPRKTLSYDRWSITVVYGDSVSEAIHVSAPQKSLLRLMAHARIVLEQVTPRGYRLFDCDLAQMTPAQRGAKLWRNSMRCQC